MNKVLLFLIQIQQMQPFLTRYSCKTALASRRKGCLMVEVLSFVPRNEPHFWWKQVLETAFYHILVVVYSLEAHLVCCLAVMQLDHNWNFYFSSFWNQWQVYSFSYLQTALICCLRLIWGKAKIYWCSYNTLKHKFSIRNGDGLVWGCLASRRLSAH